MIQAILACLLAIATGSSPALGGTNPGAFDPLFGTGGKVTFDYGDNYDYGKQVLIQPDGKYLLVGYGSTFNPNLGFGFIARHNRDGSFDTTFNGTGRRVFGDNALGADFASAALLPDGRIIVAGYDYNPAGNGTVRGFMARLNANGTTDATFGTGGEVRLSPVALPWLIFRWVALRPDGTIVVVGREYDSTFNDYRSAVFRFLANGQLDTSFGAAGRVSLGTLAPNFSANKMILQGDGKIVIAGYSLAASPSELAVVLRLNVDGSPDGGFATGGKYTQPIAGFATEFYDFQIGADGSLALVGYGYSAPSDYKAFVLRLSAAGAPDPTFGVQGLLTLAAPVALAQGLLLQPDGKIVVSGAASAGNAILGLILRLQPNGQLDTGFGSGGLNQNFGYANSVGDKMALDVDGKIVMAGTAAGLNDSLLARFIGDEITTPVIEFFNDILIHYFITANPLEASAIDGGSAGPGWSRTGQTFNSGGPNRVCRFYGNPDINPVSGLRSGPNGHFYTIDPDECAAVKLDTGWRFESYDFNGWPKTGVTSCPPGTVPVYRTYNKRFTFNDSNHRYTTSVAVYNQMVGMGWNGEGVVFCAPA